MTRIRFLLPFLLAPLVVAGCAGTGDRVPAGAGPVPASAAAPTRVANESAAAIDGVRFTFRTGGPIRGTPLVVGGAVYVGSGDGNVYALDARTGVERWRHATGGAVMSSAAWADGRVYIASRDGHLYAFDAGDGTVRWRHAFGPELGPQNYWDHVLSSPVVVGTRLYIGGGDGRLYALDAASGAVRWSADLGARIRSTPAVQGDTIVVGTMAGKVVAVDAASGAVRWTFATDGAAHTFADKGNDTTSVVATPTIAAGLVTVGARDGQLYALDLATGRLAWRSTHDGASWILSTAFDGETLFVGSGSALIVQAADPATGAERWRFKTEGAVFSSIAIARDALVFSDFNGVLYGIDRRSGALRWRFPMGERALATPAVADGVVYAASDGGVLFALDVARVAPAPLTVPVEPRRIAYREGQKTPQAYAWFRNGVDLAVLGQLKGAGYEEMTASGLGSFMAATTAASAPSVVVFTDNLIPPTLVDTSAGAAPIRRYLEAGGKVVLLGPNPVIYKTDAATGELVDIDHGAPLAVFGVRYPPPDIVRGFYAARPTAAGRAMGLRATRVGFLAVDADSGPGFTALALDEFGKASAWLQSYGGRRGTGLMQLVVPRQDVADLSDVQAAIEFGIGW